MTRPRQINSEYSLLCFFQILVVALHVGVQAYHRNPCPRHVASDFSFPNCYLPDQDDELLLSGASFVLSHDAATGFIKPGFSRAGISSVYSKTQEGILYEQLDSGARALDLILANGTTIFHHGAIRIHVAFESAIEEVVRWAKDNPTELVLLLTSHFSYENSFQYDDDPDAMITALESIYTSFGISYLTCGDIYGWTIGDAKEGAALSGGAHGYLLAVDGRDFSGTGCAKENYVECRFFQPGFLTSREEKRTNVYVRFDQSHRSLACLYLKAQLVTCWGHNNKTSCKNSREQWERLKIYTLASANNEPTDDNSRLGPPYSLDVYPFNEIQALWQVDGHAVAMGISHFSSIIKDNHASNVNADMVDLIYNGVFNQISLLAVDNVALHGNALLSVLRNTCGQSISEDCGTDVPPPPMRRWRLSRLWTRMRHQGNSLADPVKENQQSLLAARQKLPLSPRARKESSRR